ncbi:MAG: prolyl oligopeptidase family serine peptidase [Myxococcota bacterium]
MLDRIRPAALSSALVVGALVFLSLGSMAEAAPEWPPWIRTVAYPSKADNTQQLTQFYHPRQATEPVPLLVGLHSWGGGYTQRLGIAYAQWAVQHDWAFIHPDFRGPNRGPDTTGSDLVVEDIISAVEYAFEHANIDRDRVYVIGYSGGGHVGLLLAARAPSYWTAISAWGAISDLALWHREVTTVAPRYLHTLEACCGGPPGTNPDVDNQYRRRSPLGILERARDRVAIDLNAGLYDGHQGAPVPVRQALLAFNALAQPHDTFSQEEIEHITQKADIPTHLKGEMATDQAYKKHARIFRRQSGPVRVTLFDGGHNMLPQPGLEWLSQQRRSHLLRDNAHRAAQRMLSALDRL